jgi:hypothetical protein
MCVRAADTGKQSWKEQATDAFFAIWLITLALAFIYCT